VYKVSSYVIFPFDNIVSLDPSPLFPFCIYPHSLNDKYGLVGGNFPSSIFYNLEHLEPNEK
jgi:hypothetical protein